MATPIAVLNLSGNRGALAVRLSGESLELRHGSTVLLVPVADLARLSDAISRASCEATWQNLHNRAGEALLGRGGSHV